MKCPDPQQGYLLLLSVDYLVLLFSADCLILLLSADCLNGYVMVYIFF